MGFVLFTINKYGVPCIVSTSPTTDKVVILAAIISFFTCEETGYFSFSFVAYLTPAKSNHDICVMNSARCGTSYSSVLGGRNLLICFCNYDIHSSSGTTSLYPGMPPMPSFILNCAQRVFYNAAHVVLLGLRRGLLSQAP